MTNQSVEWRWAKRGMLVSALIGSAWIGYVVDVTVTPGEHKGTYGPAMIIMSGVCILGFVLLVAFGMLIGGVVGRLVAWQRSRVE